MGVMVIAACGGDAGGSSGPVKLKEPVSLQYWSILGGADGSRMREMTAQYTKEQPMVKIDDVQGVENFLVKFVASVVAGSPPDIVWIRQTYIAGFVENDALLPLLPKELDQIGLKAEDFDQVVWKASEYKGKRYTVPMDIHGYQFFYHEAMVRDGGLDPAKVPTTWAEWLDWATRLTKEDKRGATVPYSGAGINWFFHGFLKQAAKANVGGATTADLFTADGKKANFNNPAGVEALQLMADVFKRCKLPFPDGVASLDLFEQKKLGSMINGPWNLNRLANPKGPAANELRVAFSPQRDPKNPSWWAQSHQVALAKPAKVEDNKRTGSFNFIKWLNDNILEWSKAGQLPANKKVLSSDAYQKSDLLVHKHLKVWEKNLPTATFMPLHPKHVEVENDLPPILEKAIRGNVSVQAALAEGETLVNTILSKSRDTIRDVPRLPACQSLRSRDWQDAWATEHSCKRITDARHAARSPACLGKDRPVNPRYPIRHPRLRQQLWRGCERRSGRPRPSCHRPRGQPLRLRALLR